MIPANAVSWQAAIGPITDNNAVELQAAVAGKRHYLTTFHVVNEHASNSTRVQILSASTILGYT